MRTLIVYESMFGNTEAVARAVGAGLELEGLEVLVQEVSDADPGQLLDAALLVVGAPTHGFTLSRPATREDAVQKGAPADRVDLGLREWLTALPPVEGRQDPALVAAFDTRDVRVRHLPRTAAHRAARMARAHGLREAGKAESFLVTGVSGPLQDGELDRATAWGRRLAGLCRIHAAALRSQQTPPVAAADDASSAADVR